MGLSEIITILIESMKLLIHVYSLNFCHLNIPKN